eukprot:CAMPEP_0195523964 /NCGR_PEP_ID=MMETSP0794_2-20130614/23494_1 /TAXON_ID=515487 /ORGANISM="Stephanopyxis turris, Strain CCMP 815" /LENGTH=472 /DNA_ID=CAMNT_0040654079 /DNA_START=360 /DNA_END=1778 /DNA_ORIENTATION=+
MKDSLLVLARAATGAHQFPAREFNQGYHKTSIKITKPNIGKRTVTLDSEDEIDNFNSEADGLNEGAGGKKRKISAPTPEESKKKKNLDWDSDDTPTLNRGQIPTDHTMSKNSSFPSQVQGDDIIMPISESNVVVVQDITKSDNDVSILDKNMIGTSPGYLVSDPTLVPSYSNDQTNSCAVSSSQSNFFVERLLAASVAVTNTTIDPKISHTLLPQLHQNKCVPEGKCFGAEPVKEEHVPQDIKAHCNVKLERDCANAQIHIAVINKEKYALRALRSKKAILQQELLEIETEEAKILANISHIEAGLSATTQPAMDGARQPALAPSVGTIIPEDDECNTLVGHEHGKGDTPHSNPSAIPKPSEDAGTDTNNVCIQPQINDVLCGRGGMVNNHPGNQRFLKIVEQNKPQYDSLDKQHKKKTELSQTIVDQVHAYGGRFLKKEKKSGAWCRAENIDARKKVSYAFRDASREKKKT